MSEQYKKQLCISGIKLLHYAAAITVKNYGKYYGEYYGEKSAGRGKSR